MHVLLMVVLFSTTALAQIPSTEPIESVTYEFEWRHLTDEAVPDGTLLEELNGQVRAKFTLQLPDQCDTFNEHHDFLNNHSLDTRGINRVIGANSLCIQASELSRGATEAEYDFVSGIDFQTLPLDLIPYDPHCSGIMNDAYWEFCEAVERRDPDVCMFGSYPDHLSWVRFQMVVDWEEVRTKLDCRPLVVDHESCRLNDATFVGEVVVEGTQARCRSDANNTGFRIADVRLRDMNHDGFMDAVVSVVPAGGTGTVPGGSQQFVLTRRGEDAALEWVEE